MVTFAFSPNSIRNATFSPHPNGQPSYTLSTDVRSNSKTTIANAQTGAVVAYIERNEILPDTVKFSGRNEGKKMRVSKWLVAGKTPDKLSVCCIQCQCRGEIIDWMPDQPGDVHGNKTGKLYLEKRPVV